MSIKDFSEKGRVADTIEFGTANALEYIIERGPVAQPAASFSGNHIKVSIPREMGLAWANTGPVSMAYDMPLDTGQSLYILVEKDFKCLTERKGEDESDNFPNPNSNRGCSFNCVTAL